MKFLCIFGLYFTAQNSSWLSTIPRKTRPVQLLCMTLHTLHYPPHPQVEWSRTRSLVGPLSSPGPWMDGGSQGIYQLNAQWEEHSLGNQKPHPDRLYCGTSSSNRGVWTSNGRADERSMGWNPGHGYKRVVKWLCVTRFVSAVSDFPLVQFYRRCWGETSLHKLRYSNGTGEIDASEKF